MTDRDVVDAFVAHLAANGHSGLKVDSRPEDENRRTPDIDAIAGHFAIEHTSIDTLPNQREVSAWYTRALGGLEDELNQLHLPFQLSVILPYDTVRTGQDWPAIRTALMEYIVNKAPLIEAGSFDFEDLPGIPFRVHVKKSAEQPWDVEVSRFDCDDTLADQVREAFEHGAKLARYQELGYLTVLLLESRDRALMTRGKLIEAIRSSFPADSPAGVALVWFAHTLSPDTIKFRELTPALWPSAG